MKNLIFTILFTLMTAFTAQAATGTLQLDVQLTPEELAGRVNIFVPDIVKYPGSETDGIQEALEEANTAGGGLVLLDCGTTYTLTPKNGNWIYMEDMRNIEVQGCGKNDA